jgi:photosystem II stability/assembly factor-like uncharacterized protein
MKQRIWWKLGFLTMMLFLIGSVCVSPIMEAAVNGGLDTWTLRNGENTNYDLKDVAYGNNMFVAVGAENNAGTWRDLILYSATGETWTAVTQHFNKQIYAVTYVEAYATFYAVGQDGLVLTSTNGMNWTLQPFTDVSNFAKPLYNVAFGNNVVVASSDYNVYYSENKAEWKMANRGWLDSSDAIFAIAYGDNEFIAMGNKNTYVSAFGKDYWMINGTYADAGVSASIYNILYTGTQYIAVGQRNNVGAFFLSDDAVNWTCLEQPTKSIRDLATDGNTILAVTEDEKILTSADGLTWTNRYTASPYKALRGVAYGNNTFVAVGASGCILQSGPLTSSGPLAITGEKRVAAGATIQLSASEAVTWSLREMPGVYMGSIDENGLYRAPTRVPPSGKVSIYAEADSNNERVMTQIEIHPIRSDNVFVEGMSVPVPSGIGTSYGNYMFGDIGGDGITDVWISGEHRGLEGLSYYTGFGDGTFDLAKQLEGYKLETDIVFPDKSWITELNGDEFPDLVVMKDNDYDDGYDEIRSYAGDGSGQFTRLWSNRDGIATPATGGVRSPVLLFEDVDNDGDIDMISTGRDPYIIIRFNDGNGHFSGGGSYPKQGREGSYLFTGDPNNDGYLDLISVNWSSTGIVGVADAGPGVKVFLNNRDGSYSEQPLQKLWGDTYATLGTCLYGDFNADGIGDLLITKGGVYLLQGQADGSFNDPIALAISGDLRTIIQAGGDGYPDLLVTRTEMQSSGNLYHLVLWNGDGNGGFSFASELWQSNRTIHEVKVNELNRDGTYDLTLKIAPQTGASGYVVGTLLSGIANTLESEIRLFPDPRHIVNMGNRYYMHFYVEQTGAIETELLWYVNDILGGNEELGTITVQDDYSVTYLPPAANETLTEVTIKVTNADASQALTSEVSFTHYLWQKISDYTLDNLALVKLQWSSDGSRLYGTTDTSVYRSDNGGETWVAASGSGTQALPQLRQTSITSLAVDPEDALTVFVSISRYIDYDAVYGGIYKTTDGGLTWNPVNNGLPASDLVGFPDSPYFTIWDNTLVFGEKIGTTRALFASTVLNGINTDGLYRTDDGGATWRRVAIYSGNEQIPSAAATANASIVYAVRSGDTTEPLTSLFKSSDGGLTWTNLQANVVDSMPEYVFVPSSVLIDPLNENHILVVGYLRLNGNTLHETTIFESRDAGGTWSEIARAFDVSGIPVFSPTTAGVMMTTGGHLYRELEGVHWHSVLEGLMEGTIVLYPQTICIAPAGAPNPGSFYAATRGGVFVTPKPSQLPPTPTPLIITGEKQVTVGGTLQFTASEAAEWSIGELPGVDLGSIDEDGLYHAPTRVPTSGKVIIYAESLSDHEKVMTQIAITPVASDGVFVEGMSLPVPSGINTSYGTYLLEDLGGDGIADLWISGTHRNLDGLSFYTGLGDGTFDLLKQLRGYKLDTDISYPEKSWVAELTGDEYPDLVVMKDNDRDGKHDETRVYEGDGSGNFTKVWGSRDGIATPATGGLLSPVLLFEDVDSDGELDMISTGRDPYIIIRLNDGSGRFSGGGSYAKEGKEGSFVFTGDPNKDGYLDLISFNWAYDGLNGIPDAGPSIKVFLNDGFGVYTGLPVNKPWGETYDITGNCMYGDVTSDGIGDLIVSKGSVYLFEGQADGTFKAPITFAIPGTLQALFHADEDGKLDLLVSSVETLSNGNLYSIELWKGDGSGNFTYTADLWQTSRYIYEVKVAELNRDGKFDLTVKLAPKAGATGYVIGTLLSGASSAVEPGLRLQVDPRRIVNMGDRYEIYYFAEQTGTLEPNLLCYVNDILGGNTELGTITAVDGYAAKYMPPAENATLTEVTVKVTNTDGSLVETSEVSFTHETWQKISDATLGTTTLQKLHWATDGSRLYGATDTQVFWSGNGGVTWVVASGSGNQALPQTTIRSLAVDPDDPLIVYVGITRFTDTVSTYGGVYKTTDGGLTWNPVNNGLPKSTIGSTPDQPYIAVLADTLVFGERIGTSRALYASVYIEGINSDGLYRTDDGGANWRRLAIYEVNEQITSVAAARTTNVIYAVRKGDSTVAMPSLFKSSNGGLSWNNLQPNLAESMPDYSILPNFVAVDPFDDNHLIVVANVRYLTTTLSGTYTFESRDAGETWAEIGRDFDVSGTPVFSPTTAGSMMTTGGYRFTSSNGAHWHKIKEGMQDGSTELSAYAMAAAPAAAANPGSYYASTRLGIFVTPLSNSTPSSSTDFEAPTWASNTALVATNIGTNTLTLTWSAAEDNVAVTGYRLDLNGKLYASLDNVLSFNFVGLTPATPYTLTLRAKDAFNNWTTLTLATTVTTAALPEEPEEPPVEPTPAESSETGNVSVGYANGETVTIPATVSTETDKEKGTYTNIAIDEEKVMDVVAGSDAGTTLQVKVVPSSESLNVELSGKLMDAMSENSNSLGIQTPYASYTLPASEMNMKAIFEKTGAKASDAKINVSIAQTTEEETKEAYRQAEIAGFVIVGTPVKFQIEVVVGDETFVVTRFGDYVERTIELPKPVNTNFAVGVEVKPDGSFVPVPTRFKQTGTQSSAIIKRRTNSTYTVIENKKTFADVNNHWAEETITILASKLLINGTGEETFTPDTSITRAELVAVVVRALGLESAPEKVLFHDVQPDDWFKGELGAAVEAGIVNGYSNGSFKPHAYASREEMVTILQNALHYAGTDLNLNAELLTPYLDRFEDRNEISEWAKQAVAVAVKLEMIQGYADGSFKPHTNITRAEAVTMIYRMLQSLEFI